MRILNTKTQVSLMLMLSIASIEGFAESGSEIKTEQTTSAASESCVMNADDINLGIIKPKEQGELVETTLFQVECTQYKPMMITLNQVKENALSSEMLMTSLNDKNKDSLKYQFLFKPVESIGNLVEASKDLTLNMELTIRLSLNQFVTPGIYQDDLKAEFFY